MKIVAPAGCAGCKAHALMRRAFLSDLGVTGNAEIHGLCVPGGMRQFGTMLHMTGRAFGCIEPRGPFGIARVGKFAARMAVARLLELGAVAIHAARLHRLAIRKRPGVASVTRQFDLVMPVARGSRQQQRPRGGSPSLVGIAPQTEAGPQQPGQARREQQPDDPPSARTRDSHAISTSRT